MTVVDYDEGKQHFLKILATHGDVIALPGEPLGVINKAFHHTALNLSTQHIYVPSYRLPYSQGKLVDGMV